MKFCERMIKAWLRQETEMEKHDFESAIVDSKNDLYYLSAKRNPSSFGDYYEVSMCNHGIMIFARESFVILNTEVDERNIVDHLAFILTRHPFEWDVEEGELAELDVKATLKALEKMAIEDNSMREPVLKFIKWMSDDSSLVWNEQTISDISVAIDKASGTDLAVNFPHQYRANDFWVETQVAVARMIVNSDYVIDVKIDGWDELCQQAREYQDAIDEATDKEFGRGKYAESSEDDVRVADSSDVISSERQDSVGGESPAQEALQRDSSDPNSGPEASV